MKKIEICFVLNIPSYFPESKSSIIGLDKVKSYRYSENLVQREWNWSYIRSRSFSNMNGLDSRSYFYSIDFKQDDISFIIEEDPFKSIKSNFNSLFRASKILLLGSRYKHLKRINYDHSKFNKTAIL